MENGLRLGDILIEQGLLDVRQVGQILDCQREQATPFGVLCEQMFGISAERIETAWARQYASLTRTVNPAAEAFDEDVRSLVTRRQAWQFRILPIRFDDGQLMLATTEADLPRALRFAGRAIGVPLYFVMAAPLALGEALCRRYPMRGMKPGSLQDRPTLRT